jgi:hypothetical protein
MMGVRPEDRVAPGELSAGVLPSRTDRGCGAHDRPREARGVLTMDASDVIIIGTGAGVGTLARRLAALGTRVRLFGIEVCYLFWTARGTIPVSLEF